MTNSWQPQLDRGFYYDSTSDLSPVTSSSRDVVPVGTVVFRIIELQNLANSSTFNRPRSPIIHRRESSRTGFGRRVRPRFGQPASRSLIPDEEVQVDTDHSFLGLSKPRINHMEEHGLVDRRTRWDRTAGLHAQLQPRGLDTRVQYEVTSPWSFLPQSKSFRGLQQVHTKREKAALEEKIPVNQLKSQTPITLPSDSSDHQGMERISLTPEKPFSQTRDESKRRTISRQQRTSSPCEWASAETTSTMRRQSIKDLYYDYGIQRPAGLASSENIAFGQEETSKLAVERTNCHLCSWVTPQDTIKCKCGHILCEKCHCLSSEAIATSDDSADCAEMSLKVKASICWTPNAGVNLRIVKRRSRLIGYSRIRSINKSNNSPKRRRSKLKPRESRILWKYLHILLWMRFHQLTH
jgi:hypothetical protein